MRRYFVRRFYFYMTVDLFALLTKLHQYNHFSLPVASIESCYYYICLLLSKSLLIIYTEPYRSKEQLPYKTIRYLIYLMRLLC